MNRLIFKLLLSCFVCLLLFSTSEIKADWLIYKRAQVWDNNKNILRFDRASNGPVRILFYLAKPIEDVYKKKLPLYKVDNGHTRSIENMTDIVTDKEKSRWIRWTISEGIDPISDKLDEILNGKTMTFQYYYPDGFIMEATFDLTGADKAIGQVIR